MSYGAARSDADRNGNQGKGAYTGVVAASIAIFLLGAAASIELAIFRHGAGARYGWLATLFLLGGATIVGFVAINLFKQTGEIDAKLWTKVLIGGLIYFGIASLVAEQLYSQGVFALGAPRTVTAQRQIDRAKASLAEVAANRGPSGYTEDQRWAIAVDQSLVKAGETDLAYAKAVPDSDQVYPQYLTGDEPGGYQEHLRGLIQRAKDIRAKQGYPVSEPLPGYLPAPSFLESRIARAQSLAAGAEAQVPLCKLGRAAGYPNVRTAADAKECEQDWHAQSLKHLDSVARDQKELDFEREAIAKIAP